MGNFMSDDKSCPGIVQVSANAMQSNKGYDPYKDNIFVIKHRSELPLVFPCIDFN